MKLDVTVTKDDIRKGVPESLCNCPIALAVKRQYRTKAVEVSPDEIIIDGVSFGLPGKANVFIDRFDNARPVKPMTFSVSL